MLRNSDKLEGYKILGLKRKLLINLFADDATIYLSANDRYSDLQELLQSWCQASGAKFNIGKTEIIPIGSEQHRERIITTRRIHPDDEPLDARIHIAKDGDPVRSLGAWIGNKVSNVTPWEPILVKIQSHLDRWQLGHPTMDAKRLIVQMVVGGMTQYLTKVQGMPKAIEVLLIDMIRKFVWEGKQSAIAI
ncbi:hypothetical protein JAAARDRAFT_98948, partial [Jaapia argillacea MUCL 33604]